ncbi:hypothetical protein AcW1_008654 [Taiwanofungus camphoratus]|nr:hypothetical protein AcW1_008654 [Antrodia cinnamomea]
MIPHFQGNGGYCTAVARLTRGYLSCFVMVFELRQMLSKTISTQVLRYDIGMYRRCQKPRRRYRGVEGLNSRREGDCHIIILSAPVYLAYEWNVLVRSLPAFAGTVVALSS